MLNHRMRLVIVSWLLMGMCFVTGHAATQAQDSTTISITGINITLPPNWVANTDAAPHLLLIASDAASLNAPRPLPNQQLMVLTITPADSEEPLEEVVLSTILEYDPAFGIAASDLVAVPVQFSGLEGVRTSLVQSQIDEANFFLRAQAARLGTYDIEVLVVSHGTVTGEEVDQLFDGIVINPPMLLGTLSPDLSIAQLSPELPHNVLYTPQISDAVPVPIRLVMPFGWDGIARPNEIVVASDHRTLRYLRTEQFNQAIETLGSGFILIPVPENQYTPELTATELVERYIRQNTSDNTRFETPTETRIFDLEATAVRFNTPSLQGTYAVLVAGDVFLQMWSIEPLESTSDSILDTLLAQVDIEADVILTLPNEQVLSNFLGLSRLTFRIPRHWNTDRQTGYVLLYDLPEAATGFTQINLDDPSSFSGSVLSITVTPRNGFGANVNSPQDVLLALGWSEENWLYPTNLPQQITINDRDSLVVSFETPLATVYYFIVDAGNYWLTANGLSTNLSTEEADALFRAIMSSLIIE